MVYEERSPKEVEREAKRLGEEYLGNRISAAKFAAKIELLESRYNGVPPELLATARQMQDDMIARITGNDISDKVREELAEENIPLGKLAEVVGKLEHKGKNERNPNNYRKQAHILCLPFGNQTQYLDSRGEIMANLIAVGPETLERLENAYLAFQKAYEDDQTITKPEYKALVENLWNRGLEISRADKEMITGKSYAEKERGAA